MEALSRSIKSGPGKSRRQAKFSRLWHQKMASFYGPDNCIDRISVLDCQLVAYPNKLLFGTCYQLNTLYSVLPTDSSFMINNSELDYFLQLLLDFGNKTAANSQQNLEFPFVESDSKVLITTQDSYLFTFVSPNNSQYSFENDSQFKLLISAFIDLSLLTYSYSGVVNYYLYKFLNTSDSTDYSDLTDDKVLTLFNKINATVDYYMFLRIIQRHKNTLFRLKQLQTLLLDTVVMSEEIDDETNLT